MSKLTGSPYRVEAAPRELINELLRLGYTQVAMVYSKAEGEAILKRLLEEHTVSGPERNPADRGECLKLDAKTITRCDGRRIASYNHTDEGIVLRWTCDKCGEVVVP
jgi:hypothetical protein